MPWSAAFPRPRDEAEGRLPSVAAIAGQGALVDQATPDGSDRIGLASEATLQGALPLIRQGSHGRSRYKSGGAGAHPCRPLQPRPYRDRVHPLGGIYCFEEAPFA